MATTDIIFQFNNDKGTEEFDDIFPEYAKRKERLYDIKDEVIVFKHENRQIQEDDSIDYEKFFMDNIYPNLSEGEKDLFKTYIIKGLNTEEAKTLFTKLEELQKKGDLVEFVQYSVEYKIPRAEPLRRTTPKLTSWGIKRLECEKAWLTSRGIGVIVAVIDTGVDYNHEFIRGNMWLDPITRTTHGHDFVNNNDYPLDVHGHGTHCAGIVAADNQDTVRIGVAPGAKIMALKITSSGAKLKEGLVTTETQPCVQAIRYAVIRKARILSNSWAATKASVTDDSLNKALNEASLRCTIVFSAGNDNDKAKNHFPAGHAKVITVAATTSGNNRAPRSNFPPGITVGAPGYNISSLLRGTRRGTIVKDGTSMACPHVAGLIALLLQINSGLTFSEIKHLISFYGKKIKTDKGYWQLVNAYNSVLKTEP